MVSYTFPITFRTRSEQAVELSQIVKQLGLVYDLCVEDFILNFFYELNMQQKKISVIDPTVARFTSLKVLNLSFNNIQRIENLPPLLEELYLNGNQLNEIGVNPNKPLQSLIHLGVSRNQLRQTALSQIVKVFPNLFCLDISYNNLCEMESTMIWIQKLSNLVMLSLEGNPVILIPNYQKVIISRVPNVKIIDNITVPLEDRKAAEEAARERASRLSSVNAESIKQTPIEP